MDNNPGNSKHIIAFSTKMTMKYKLIHYGYCTVVKKKVKANTGGKMSWIPGCGLNYFFYLDIFHWTVNIVNEEQLKYWR